MKRILFLLVLFVSFSLSGFSQNTCTNCGTGTVKGNGNPSTNFINLSLDNVKNAPKLAPAIVNSLNSAPTWAGIDVCGLNWTSAHVLTETRTQAVPVNTNGTGFPTSLTIGGIPANCYVIEAAYLYYTASYTEGAPPVTSASFTNPALVTNVVPATLVATGPSVAWGEVGTAEYRCDVTADISGNGNYGVNLNGFANAAWEVDGCTLIIVWIAGPTNSGTATFALWDGDWVENTSSTTYSDIVSFPAPCTNTTAQAFVQISDDQANVVATHPDLFNGTPTNFPNDFYSFDVANVPLTTASTSITIQPYTNWVQGNTYDLWEWTLVGMYWQNSGCYNCLPIITMTHTNPLCNGGTGTATATVTNGTPPFTYTWSNAQTTSTATGLTAGTYTVNVEDIICNTAQAVVTITQPTPITATTTMTQATCGGNNGTATVTAGGGTPGYTYVWNPSGQTNATATGLSAGSYTVTVKDANNCTTTSVIAVTTSNGITVTMGAPTNILCNGGANGNATVTVTGGTAPYTYLWVPNGGTGPTGTGLTAGTYTVNVTDNNGCTGTASVTITQPTALVATMGVPNNVPCNGGTGSATVTVTGGTAPYTYAWVPNGGTGPTGTGLTAGSYTVNVTDNNGCATSATVVITQPALLTATTTMTQSSCGNPNGTATVTAGGGTTPYTYSWNPGGQTTATATGLTAGSYTATVTDNNGCTATSVIVVTATAGITVTMGANTNDLCNGGNNANATVTVTGGSTPYTYAWTPAGGTNATGTGLTAGTYTVNVTDNNGCTGSATVTITQPTALIATMGAPTNILCNGGATGSATVTVTGGTAPYTYAWNPNGGTGPTGTGLTAGTYTVNVTDNNGCAQSATVTITQPTAITINTTTVSANCNANNGSANAIVAGGTGPYTYLWTPSNQTNATATGLSANTYTITVTDNNGCIQTSTAIVSNLGGETVTIGAVTNVSCFGGANGSAGTNVVGGTAPYTYAWTPSGGTGPTGTGLTAGIYTVTVTDANGCIAIANVTITQPTALVSTMGVPSNILCNGGTGNATVTVTGGTGPYTYAWNPNGGAGATGTGLTAGSYTVNVTDNNGCTSSATVVITEPTLLTANINATNNVSCAGGTNGSLAVSAAGGTNPYTYAWTPVGGTNAIANNLSAGNYTVVVTDNNGCTATAIGAVTQPAAITVTTTSTQTSCQNTGTATATPAGGTTPYTYFWSPSLQTNATATALSAGTYTVTVTDNNGCTGTATATVTSSAFVTATMGAIVNVTCFGGSDGTATVTAANGLAPYTYLWSPTGGTNATGTGLSAGIYTVTVTDNSGCTATATATIVQPTRLLVTTNGTASVCSGQPANLNATVTGGTLPYTYAWSSGGSTAATVVNPVVTSTYTIVITDANGCTATGTETVNVNPALNLVVTGNKSVCPGGQVTLTATGSGGDGNYTYKWSNGSTTPSITVTADSTKTYSVTLSDGCGSTPITVSVTVTVDPLPDVRFKADLYQGCAPLCIQFRDLTTITSGGIHHWLWTFGTGDSASSRNPTYCYPNPGTFPVTLTVVSDSGCSSTLKILNMITVYNHPNANFTYTPNPVTILDPQIQFYDKSTDQYGIVEWFWTFGDKIDSSSLLRNPSHTYSDTGVYCAQLTVMNIHGCVDTTTNCFDVQAQYTLYIPDAFSPNDDNINDVFMAKGSYIKDFEMYIYDRWGMQLFHSNDIMNGWNGHVKNGSLVCQEDTYVYLINATDAMGNKHSYTGKVTLIK